MTKIKEEVSGKKILADRKKNRPVRGRVTLYLTKSVFQKFKTACEDEGDSASGVIEDLMERFLKSL